MNKSSALVQYQSPKGKDIVLGSVTDPLIWGIATSAAVAAWVFAVPAVGAVAIAATMITLLSCVAPVVPPLNARAHRRYRERFHRYKAMLRRAEHRRLEKVLPPHLKERFFGLQAQVQHALSQGRKDRVPSDLVEHLSEASTAYLRLLIGLDQLEVYLSSSDVAMIQQQLDQLEKELIHDAPAVRQVKSARRDILVRRRERAVQAVQRRDTVMAQLAMVEEMVALLVDALRVPGGPVQIEIQLTSLLEQLEATDAAASELEYTEQEELAHFEMQISASR